MAVINFESTRTLEFTAAAKREVEQLARAIRLLKVLNDAYQTQQRGTGRIIEKLKEAQVALLRKARFTRPNVFIASSERARDDVMAIIRGTIDETLRPHANVVYWKELSKTGDVTRQLQDAIAGCTVGILYLSEPCQTQPQRFVDNLNVVFEAGMLQALRIRSAAVDPRFWVPIRESNSPPMPFDLSTERTVIVSRTQDGMVNDADLRHQFSRRISSILEEMGIRHA